MRMLIATRTVTVASRNVVYQAESVSVFVDSFAGHVDVDSFAAAGKDLDDCSCERRLDCCADLIRQSALANVSVASSKSQYAMKAWQNYD